VTNESSKLASPGQEAQPPPAPRRGSAVILPIALFLLGVMTGALALALYGLITDHPLIVRRLGSQGADVAQIREAARDGTLDAIATLQAGGGPQPATPTPAPTPTQLPKDAIAVREANRLGKPDAPVVVFEYSDFQ
jgi:hypothetical protein